MKFYVGQRVRFIGGNLPAGVPQDPNLIPRGTLGYVRPDQWGCVGRYITEFDGHKSAHHSGLYASFAYQLEPVYEGDSFSRFMERVLEPRPELQGLTVE